MKRPFPAKLSRADLAHAHLKRFWEELDCDGEAVLAVPGWYSLEQLGLILGMARACEIPVNGMMDSALAAAATVSRGRALVHLDVHLHRVAAARIVREDQLVRENTVVDDRGGVVNLHDAWVTLVSERFVHQTRFDPLHAANSEQNVYDRLPSWLGQLRTEGSARLTLESSGKTRSIELTRTELVRAAEPYYDSVVALAVSVLPPEQAVTLLVSHRLSALPGLVERLRRDVSSELVELPATAAAAGALAYERQVPRSDDEGALTFLTSLSVGDEAKLSEPEPLPRIPTSRRPTHILHDGRAYAIGPEPFLLGVSIPEDQHGLNLEGETAGISRYHCRIYRVEEVLVVEDRSKFGCFLNGRRVHERSPVTTGDRLRVGTPGIELQFIEVTP